MNRLPIRLATVLGILALAATAGMKAIVADETDQPASKTMRFVLHPAEPPRAVMKYRLLPRYIEQSPGNAAPHYFRAALMWENEKANQDALANISDWLELPLDELRKNGDVAAFINGISTNQFDVIRLAALREHCDWESPLREFNFSTNIPELIRMRNLGQVVALRARWEMAQGRLDEAVKWIQTGMALARHAADTPTLVNGLVGISLSGLMLHQVQELVQQPKCPNLYWTLSALPEPCIDLRKGMEMEQDGLYLFLPGLRNVSDKTRTEEQWNELLAEVLKKLMDIMPKGQDEAAFWAKGALFAVTAYPKAKAQLAEAGYAPAKIKGMSVAQAILTASAESFERQRDSLHRWFYLPFGQASIGMDDEERKLGTTDEIIPFARLLLPALRKVRLAQVRLERDVAALKCVEAIRLYAAKHEGQLPKQLGDIKEVPLPDDPVTGAAFKYEVRGDRASITSPVPLGDQPSLELRWEIELAGRKK